MFKILSLNILLISTTIAYCEDLPHIPLSGVYSLVGQAPNSGKTYSGTVQIFEEKKEIKIERIIDGIKSKGHGKITARTADSIPVLELSFEHGNKTVTAICLFQTDLDNYARISCRYGDQAVDESPGMETYFIKHNSR